MPAFTGPVQIFNVGGGSVQFGDTAVVSPKTSTKSTSGSGSLSTGGFVFIIDGLSFNATIDSQLLDQPIVGNN
ncbi:spore germination protein [Bacillus sp. FJAT-50079]|uniref:spore germination protein n=1 Tax=Bacillus sp. FJAT-50079 TaxID=2833577 RepID=UPI001BC9A4D3|nr:spore germination protein [Bacillus sp. FJAT-50079]MBS4210667.1 spore germination protein [Bacillus sp. FJAT-50079]